MNKTPAEQQSLSYRIRRYSRGIAVALALTIASALFFFAATMVEGHRGLLAESDKAGDAKSEKTVSPPRGLGPELPASRHIHKTKAP